LTASLEATWAKKVVRDLDGLAKHGHKPERVIAITNRRTGAKRRGELEKEASEKRGYKLRIIDVRFLARRLLSKELLPVREELLGLAPPQPPVAVDASKYAARQIDLGAPDTMLGREEELDELVRLLKEHTTVRVIGPGGIGKTRLILEAANRLGVDRVLSSTTERELTPTYSQASSPAPTGSCSWSTTRIGTATFHRSSACSGRGLILDPLL